MRGKTTLILTSIVWSLLSTCTFAAGAGTERGQGRPAAGGSEALDAIKAVRKEHPTPQDRFPGGVPQQTGKFDVPALEKILGVKAEDNKGTIKFTFARTGMMDGISIGGSMGLTTWASFSGNPDQAVADGDFIMTGNEVQPVMHALRKAGIRIVALHNHMIGDQPPFYFLHFWGKGRPEELAQGIKAALATQQGGH